MANLVPTVAAENVATPWEWEDVYENLGPNLVDLGMKRYGLSREDAEDALQKTAEAIAHADALVPVRSREAYFTTSFLHAALRLAKHRRSRGELPLIDGVEPPTDERHVERLETLIRVRRAVASLSPDCRALVVSWLETGNLQESAAFLQLSDRQVYRQRDRCWKRLIDALG